MRVEKVTPTLSGSSRHSPGFACVTLSGASGFIGRRLAAKIAPKRQAGLCCLVKKDEDAFGQTGVDYLLSRSIPLIPTDITRGTGLRGLPKPDILFHLAA